MFAQAQRYFPGLLTCATIAMASTFIAEHYGGPVMLFALLFGTAFHFLSETPRCAVGIEFCATTLLRLGVALLGFRMTFEQIENLGYMPIGIVLASVIMTIAMGVLVARLLGLSSFLGILASCAVAICGASAALAVAAILPFYKDKERDTVFVVVIVTALSTIAMIFYPVLAQNIGLSPDQMGVFLGGTIHDVAQVVGAGYSISDPVGDVATVIKLFRVALLVPVVIFFSLLLRKHHPQHASRSILQTVPTFLIAFSLFVVINSIGLVPAVISEGLSGLSRWLLLLAIAALGVKTSFQALGQVGIKPIVLMVIGTLILALLMWLAEIYFMSTTVR